MSDATAPAVLCLSTSVPPSFTAFLLTSVAMLLCDSCLCFRSLFSSRSYPSDTFWLWRLLLCCVLNFLAYSFGDFAGLGDFTLPSKWLRATCLRRFCANLPNWFWPGLEWSPWCWLKLRLLRDMLCSTVFLFFRYDFSARRGLSRLRGFSLARFYLAPLLRLQLYITSCRLQDWFLWKESLRGLTESVLLSCWDLFVST